MKSSRSTKANRERVGRKQNPFERSNLLEIKEGLNPIGGYFKRLNWLGIMRDLTLVGGCFEVNSTSHMVMDSGSKVANWRCLPCVQIWCVTDPIIG
jgi:hypothetical protein